MQNIVEKLRSEGRDEGGQAHARATLRRVLSLRNLVPSRQEESRIDTCTDLTTLDRWIDQAVTAQSVADALRAGAAEAGNRPPLRRRKARSAL